MGFVFPGHRSKKPRHRPQTPDSGVSDTGAITFSGRTAEISVLNFNPLFLMATRFNIF